MLQSLPKCFFFYRNTNVLRERTSTNPSHRNSFRCCGWYKNHTLFSRRVASTCVLICMALLANAISSPAPETFSQTALISSNVSSNVCSEPKSSSRKAISSNLHQLQPTDVQQRWHSITWMLSGGKVGKRGEEQRGSHAVLSCRFIFSDFKSAFWETHRIPSSRWHVAPSARVSSRLTVSTARKTRTRTCTLCAHMQSLRLSPTEGSSAQDIALGRNRSWKCCGCFAVYLELTGWKEEEEENRRQLPRRNDKKHLFYPPKPEGIVFISETYCKRLRISQRPRSARYK